MKILNTIFILLILVCSVSADTLTVEQALVEQMFDEYQLDRDFYEIEILSNRLHLQDFNNEDLFIKPLTMKEPIGLYTVLVTISKDGEELETSQVRMRIKKFANVLITTDRVKRHDELTTENTTIERTEVTSLRTKPIYTLEEAMGYRAKGSIQKAVPVTTGMLDKIPDILSGSETTIVYLSSAFKITADGIALQSGSEGDFIRVKNKTSNKIIVARIIDSDHVTIDP